MKPALLRESFSAGGVVCKVDEDGSCRIALIRLRGMDFWTLPKGLVEQGETPERTALREVREETGLDCSIKCKLGDIAYWYEQSEENVKTRKTVRYFLMNVLSGNITDHDNEVDEVLFFTLDEALATLKYKNDRLIVERAVLALKETLNAQ